MARSVMRPPENLAKGNSLALSFPLYLGFAAAGFCCALPGALLPDLLVKWGLDDRHGGVLFFLLWMGASLAALMVRGRLRSSIASGCVLIALSSASMALFAGRSAPALMFFYGVGLGLTMTAISMLRQQQIPEARSVELVRLNLMWAIGAFACPVLITHSLRIGSPNGVLLIVAAFFATLSLWTLLFESNVPRVAGRRGRTLQSWLALRDVPPQLLLMTMLATGIEASGGAWLATYAKREEHTLVYTIAAPTCLWAGLLASRLLGSFPGAEKLLHRSLSALLFLILLAADSLLLGKVNGYGILVGAFLLGFGLGPVYPILLARVLKYRQTSTIFFLAGVASAVMPWLTGLLSSKLGSLRSGFLVPATGAVLLVTLGLTQRER